MIAFPLLAATFIMKVVAAVWLICAVALILIVLIQKGRGGGLSAAFGGGMASGILGSKTGDFLTWLTIALIGMFLTLAVLMAKFYKPSISDFGGGAAVRTEVPQSSLPPMPIGEVGGVTGEVDDSADTNSPGG